MGAIRRQSTVAHFLGSDWPSRCVRMPKHSISHHLALKRERQSDNNYDIIINFVPFILVLQRPRQPFSARVKSPNAVNFLDVPQRNYNSCVNMSRLSSSNLAILRPGIPSHASEWLGYEGSVTLKLLTGTTWYCNLSPGPLCCLCRRAPVLLRWQAWGQYPALQRPKPCAHSNAENAHHS